MAEKEKYRELRAELDEVLLKIRDGELDIEAATKEYERAKLIVDKLEKYLKNAENTVSKIKKTSA